MNPISIESFADGVMKNNPGEYERDSLIAALRTAAEAKKNGDNAVYHLRRAHLGSRQRHHRNQSMFCMYDRRSRR